MHDQANELRRLVGNCAPPDRPASGPRPTLVVVASGKGGVGTTTIAVSLAVAIARRRLRTVLLEADPNGGDLAILCGIEQRYTLADVLASRRTVCEVLQRGPGAIGVLSGTWGLESTAGWSATAGRRLLGELQQLGGQTDVLIVDAGSNPHAITRRFWQAADLILAVTTPATPSIVKTYASIKAAAGCDRSGPIHSLVNMAPTAEIARNVHGRLARACRRLLGIDLHSAGHVVVDPTAAAAGTLKIENCKLQIAGGSYPIWKNGKKRFNPQPSTTDMQ